MTRLLRSVLFMAAAIVLPAGLNAQVLPLAVGDTWTYVQPGSSDTLHIGIIGSAQVAVRCRRGNRRLNNAWVDNDRYAYLNVPGGVVVAVRPRPDGPDTAVVPLFFLPNTLKKGAVPAPSRQECCGEYSFVGFASVTTPAGVFDACLIFDDHNVHRLYIGLGVGIVKEERYTESDVKGGAAAERIILWSRVLAGYSLKTSRGRGADGHGAGGEKTRTATE